MSEKTEANDTPLLELARAVPRGAWAGWGSQHTPTVLPVGKYIHELADRVEELESKLRHHQEMERVWKENAEALAEIANAVVDENEFLREKAGK